MIYKLQKERKINYSNINKNAIKNLQYVDNELEKAGYGYIQRLAILGNIQRESSGNPLAISLNGKWHGLIQWDKNRYRIQSSNVEEELKRQTALLIKELEKTGWSGWTWKDQVANSNSFKSLSDLKQAVDMFTRKFVRPKDVEGEIAKRLVFAQNGFINEDSEYDLDTALKVLPQEQVNAWTKDPENNHLSSGYTDKQGNYHYLKSSQHESFPKTMEAERKDPEASRAMTRYMNPNNYVSKFLTYSPVTSGLPASVSGIGQGNMIYKPMISKKQEGGLIYKPFVYTRTSQKKKSDDLVFDFLNDTESKYPVEEVSIYTPREDNVENAVVEQQSQYNPAQTTTTSSVVTVEPVSTTSFHEGTTITPGTIKYRTSNRDLGNLKDFAQHMVDAGISFTVTSGLRPGATTKSGNRSRHADGNAIDVVLDISDEEFMQKLKNSPQLQQDMKNNKIRILDESDKLTLQRTGGTGKHKHISFGGERFGKDLWNNVYAIDDDWYAYTGKNS